MDREPDQPELVHQDAARWRKAAHLVAALFKHGVPPSDVHRFSEDDWQQIAQVAGVKPPSDTTLGMLRAMMRSIPEPA